MKRTLKISIFMLFTIVLSGPLGAATRLGLHVTHEELEIWKERAVNGPYLDDWIRVQTRAQEFLANKDVDLYPGNQLEEPFDPRRVYAGNQPPNFVAGRRLGDRLRDAGFMYLITQETRYRDAVREALLKQVHVPGTDFTNTTKWDPAMERIDNGSFEISNWLRRLAYGYSYIRSDLSPADQDAIDTWFKNAAMYWDGVLHRNIAQTFPNRLEDQYSLPGCSNVKGKTHWQGHDVCWWFLKWSNIPALHNAMIAAVGVMLDEAVLKQHAKRFVKEWLVYAVAGDGTVVDQYRWNTNNGDPEVGFLYAGTAIGSIISAVDHLARARAGDMELYEFETSEGYYGWDGGPKSLKLVMQRYADLVMAERGLGPGAEAYASLDSVLAPDKLIGPHEKRVNDINLATGNRYYRLKDVESVYTRPMPSINQSGSNYDIWGGDWGTYPGVLFMFGQLEGQVWPYPLSPPPPDTTKRPPLAPQGLRINR